MSEARKSLVAAKGYLIGLILTFVVCLFVIFEIVEIGMFCLCGDPCCLLLAGGALVGIVFIVLAAISFVRKNKHIRI